MSKRTIPTHVGRTPASKSRARAASDHPHARGENPQNWSAADRRSGPSPRTWGERRG